VPNGDVIALLGGLGNQLFQVAFSNWLGQQTGRDISYDVSFRRPGGLDILSIPDLGPDIRDCVLWRTRRWPTVDGRLPYVGRALRAITGPRRIMSSYTSAGPADPDVRAAAWWFGYWQRLEYAQALTGPLRDALDIGSAPRSDPLVGIHVRRGDMLQTDSSISGNWFGAALAALQPGTKERVRVWSDDPEWCRTRLDLGVPFEIAANGPPVEHLRGLASCSALVISRSTFSWWAGAIAADRGARIVFPTPWWPHGPDLDGIIMPSDWIPVGTMPRRR
jgi:hypothetical protein